MLTTLRTHGKRIYYATRPPVLPNTSAMQLQRIYYRDVLMFGPRPSHLQLRNYVM
jgi:hypothetical protein